MERVVCSRFRIKKKIGAGSFGEIYSGENIVTHDQVAVKVEKVNARIPQLAYEAKLYRVLAGCTNVPKFHHFGQDSNNNALVMDLMGKSLEDLFVQCKRKFSLKTVLMLADQMLASVEFMHSKNYIHRDIKPDNFVVGLGRTANQVFIIDYGLAKRYRDQNTHEHIKYSEGKQLTGTARYASVGALRGNEQSRRDDLEALGYVWIYLLKGGLPWMGINIKNRKQKYDRICEIKRKTSVNELCRGCPTEFIRYFNEVRALRFTDQPNYAVFRQMFRDLFVRKGFVYDYKYDWTVGRPNTGSRPLTATSGGRMKVVKSANVITPAATARRSEVDDSMIPKAEESTRRDQSVLTLEPEEKEKKPEPVAKPIERKQDQEKKKGEIVQKKALENGRAGIVTMTRNRRDLDSEFLWRSGRLRATAGIRSGKSGDAIVRMMKTGVRRQDTNEVLEKLARISTPTGGRMTRQGEFGQRVGTASGSRKKEPLYEIKPHVDIYVKHKAIGRWRSVAIY